MRIVQFLVSLVSLRRAKYLIYSFKNTMLVGVITCLSPHLVPSAGDVE